MTSQSQDYFLTASTNKNAADVPLYLINGVPRLSKLLSFSLRLPLSLRGEFRCGKRDFGARPLLPTINTSTRERVALQ
jgi:hypothetical protein